MPPKRKVYQKRSLEEYVRGGHEYLIIVESPSKCAKIEKFLGSRYKCVATVGHLREISGLKSIHTQQNYNIEFTLSSSKQEHVTWLRNVIRQFPPNNILLASDDDREGESIAWHVCDIFGLNVETTPRILFHEVTETALLRAVSKPGRINMNLVRAQWSRQVLDMLIGFKISPILWKYLYYNKENSLSAGRCQTPALRLVYDNEQERIHGKGLERTYKILGDFTGRHLEFVLSEEFTDKEKVLDFMEKSKTFTHILSLGSPKNATLAPPKPFNTSCLLQSASNVLHLSPKDTMKLCQVLYQNGHITYMRTENKKYSQQFVEEAHKYIETTWSTKHLGERETVVNQDTNNPHEAIRVTHLDVLVLEGSEYVGKIVSLYQLIWKNTVQSCMAAYQYQTLDANITSPIEGVYYKHRIEVPTFLGWSEARSASTSKFAGGNIYCITGEVRKEALNTIIGSHNSMENDQSKGMGVWLYLKTIVEKTPIIEFNQIASQMTFHNRHSHYTESSLIKKLEDFGIGRPSTFAIFIDTILERGYVKKTDIEGETIMCEEYKMENPKKQIICDSVKRVVGNEKAKLVIQPTGTLVIEFLLTYFDSLFDYHYTRELEDKLDIISANSSENPWYELCGVCDQLIKTMLTPLNTLSKQTFPLDAEHVIMFTKYGPMIQKHGSPEEKPIPVKKNIKLDLEQLKRGKYTLEDLEDVPNRCLGEWEGEPIYIKQGRFGHYLEWGNKKKSCSKFTKTSSEITIEDVEAIIESKDKTHMNILRELNSEMSVRRGRFGAYVYYQKPGMKTPKFLSIKKFKEGFLTCKAETLIEWVTETYGST